MDKLESIFAIVTLLTYLVAGSVYIWFLITRNRRAANLATMLLILGLFTHTLSLGMRWADSGHPPLTDSYESLSLFSWGIVLFYLITERIYPIRAAGAIVVPTAFVIESIALVLNNGPEPLRPILNSGWLWIHVTIAMLSYGFFALAFGAGFFYVVQEYLLKKRYQNVVIAFALMFALVGLAVGIWMGFEWANPSEAVNAAGQYYNQYASGDVYKILGAGGIGFAGLLFLGLLAGKGASRPSFAKRLPSLDVLDEVSYRAIAFGFPMVTIAIVTGAIWADKAWGSWWSWDPKETWSLITWLFYGAYLHTRLTWGWRGRHSAIIAIIGLMVVLFTYIGVNYLLPGLHSYVR